MVSHDLPRSTVTNQIAFDQRGLHSTPKFDREMDRTLKGARFPNWKPKIPSLLPEAWFPLDRNRIVKSRDSSRFWLIAEKLITTENKSLIEIISDLQPERFLSILTNLRAGS